MPASVYQTQDLAQGIVSECHAQFAKLPKHGKPTKKSNGQAEWTILAAIVLATPLDENEESWDVECISLATGSKCLPQGKQSPKGDLLNDCHAEVLARRGFNKWCLEQMRFSLQDSGRENNKFKFIGDSAPLSLNGNKRPLFDLVNPKSRFHLYVSQAPCGDATTASLAQVQSEESRNSFMKGQKTQEISSSYASTGSKRTREENEGFTLNQPQKHRRVSTPETPQIELDSTKPSCIHALDFRRGRIDYDSVGVLRTKPGRVDSEPTLCMSCSDKIARWNVLGLTSALVAPFLKKPLYLTSIITKELFDAQALSRALVERVRACDCLAAEGDGCSKRLSPHTMDITECHQPFEFSKEAVTKVVEREGCLLPPVASASSISWIAAETSSTEVLINGCKAGANAKKEIKPASRSRLCKLNMLDSTLLLWASLKSKIPDLVLPQIQHLVNQNDRTGGDNTTLDNFTYGDWKRLDKEYRKARDQLLQTVFKNWVRNDPDLEKFHGIPKSVPMN
ncbi:tRNA-specific adenosine deaminase 1 [Entomortierella parvispora]|uniref:tRNA-specific adenosine deaminase 1 n=1 Tax=Entomortierella parvispora TaxID=205924 RepID=A0A9P3H938_9FUNG|nr:tRNA-specific adenosine deaminase 1 [Entomortierella parvispora]